MIPEQRASTRPINRRQMIRHSGVGLTLAAAHALVPFVGGGCQRSGKSPSERIRVGILHSETGTMGLNESALRDAELMAIDEINADGGVLGLPIEPVVEDTRSDFREQFPKKATKLLSEDRVAAVFGCWTSASRKAVLPVFETLNGLLFYPLQYEGNESSFNVVYSGSLPNQQILPAIDWLMSDAGGSRKRFYLVGSDYVFPWTAHFIIRKYLAALAQPGLEVVGYHYAPLAHRDFTGVVDEIQQLQPDVIFSTINGESNRHFFKALAAAGISAASIPVVSTSVGEDELRSMHATEVQGHLAAWSYFQSIDTPRNRRFVRRFQNEHGEDRVLDDPMEAAYSQVYLWKLAVEKAQSFAVDAVRDALMENIEFKAPGGPLKLDPQTLHAYKRLRIGRVRDHLQFDIIHESPDWISPDPYPNVAFPGWRCDWTREGLTQGVRIMIGRPTPT